MDDDWDDGAPLAPAKGLAFEGGTKFLGGRGFKGVEAQDDNWSSQDNSNGFGDDAPSNGFGGGRPSRGGGYRGRGGRGGSRDSRNTGGWGDSNENEDEDNGFRGRGGRGGRGRGGGGRGGGNRGGDNRDGGTHGGDSWGDKPNDDEPQKPKEIYIPVERVNDEDLFTQTISSGVNFMKLDEIEVKVTGENVPNPMTSFEHSGLRPHLLTNIKKSNYTKPTPIQKYAIPIILGSRDLMACAQTGSGKTAAFLLPMIHKLLETQEPAVVDGSTCQPNVIIVSPTRELAIQIFDQARKFASNSIIKTVVAYGGTSVNHQRQQVQKGCHILVATPGRLNDFVEHGHVSFASVQFFVLDEADRMLDMGFLSTVEQMLGHPTMVSTGERQTLMFSATFPEEIQHLAGKFLHNYIFVAVGIVGSASTDVEQTIFEVSKFEKRSKLMDILKASNERTVVFVETKRNADFLATYFSENDVQCTSIHGDRLQREREQALWDFKKGIRKILIATSVAARGLDIEGIQHVINYDLPKSIDEYVHRIGRTGRLGNRGKATSFYDASMDGGISGALANILKQAGQEVPAFLSGGGYSGQNSDSFGGRDIRGDNFGHGQNYVQNPAEVPEDDW